MHNTYAENPGQNPGLLTLIELLDLPDFEKDCKVLPNGGGSVPK